MAGRRLQDEIGKRRPFESIEEEASLNLWRTADRVQNRFGRLFQEHGLTSSQYNVLRILRGEGGPLPCLEVASRMITAVPGITGLLDRLEEKGLIQRERSTADRRVVRVAITEAGQRILGGLDGPVLALNRRLMGGLTQDELRELNRLLEKARGSIGAEAGEG